MPNQRRGYLSSKDFLRMTALRVGVPVPLGKALRALFCGVPAVRQGVKAGGVL